MKNIFKKEEEFILLERLKNGDKLAFSTLFRQYATLVLSVARQYLQDEEEAREIVQETFYRVWKYRQNIDASLSFKAYVITISKRLLFNKADKKLHEIAYREYYRYHGSDKGNTLEEMINFQELDQKITEGIASLPPKRKEIFILSREKGLTNQEIADQLHISVSTVENQMNKSLKYLRELITFILLLILV